MYSHAEVPFSVLQSSKPRLAFYLGDGQDSENHVHAMQENPLLWRQLQNPQLISKISP